MNNISTVFEACLLIHVQISISMSNNESTITIRDPCNASTTAIKNKK